MSVDRDSLPAQVAGAGRLVRRRAQLSLGLAGVAALATVLIAGWALGVAWPRPTFIPLLVDLLLIGLAAGVLLYWRRTLRHRLGRSAVAAAAERRLGLDSGSLRGILELNDHLPSGTSAALARRAERVLHTRTRPHAAGMLAGELGDRWRSRLQGAAAVAIVASLGLALLAFSTPERTLAGWAPLFHPVRHLSPPPLPTMLVRPGDAQVPRGEALAVLVTAPGREVVTLKWRLEGDVLQQQLLTVTADSAAGTIPAVHAPGSYWVESPDGVVSARYRLMPVDALLLAELSVDVLYPSYLSQPAERFEGDVPPLELPAGTTLRISGRATRPLAAAGLQGAQGVTGLPVSGDSFTGSWQPTQSGLYSWLLRDSTGGVPSEAPPPLELVIVGDQAPSVEVTFPGTDTILAPDLKQPLAADARDDHGLAGATLVSWRVRAAGGQDPAATVALPLDGNAERVLLRTILDASARSLTAGDTLKYFIRVTDASPAGQIGVSATYSLRMPGADELRGRARAEAQAAVEDADALSQRAAELQRHTRNADRNAQTANARRGRQGGQAGGEPGQESGQARFEETEDARRVLAEQREVLQQVEQLSASLAALQESMAAAGTADEELRQRLEEAKELFDQLATPELRREVAALEQALQRLDPAQLQRALERLAEQQEEMKEQLDRTLALMREAAAAQEMAALSQEARELATQQRALAEAHAEPKTPAESDERAKQQEELKEQGDSLLEQLEALRDSLRAQSEPEAAARTDAATTSVAAARDSMEQAAASAARQQGEQAARAGRAAAGQLEEAAESLDSARREAAAQREQEAAESMQQATRDALALAQKQQELQEEMSQGRQGQQRPEPGQPAGSEDQPSKRPGRQATPQPGGQQGGQQPEQPGGNQRGDQQGSGADGKQGGGSSGQPGSSGDLGRLRAEQGAVQQGLEQLGRNLAEAGEQNGSVSREVGAALNRAHTSMEQTRRALERAERSEQLPAEQAAQTVDALNRLALSLLQNAQQLEQSQGGSGTQQAREQLADLAQQQGSINGQANSLQPLSLSPSAQADQVRRLGREQQQLADKLGGMNDMLGGREDVLGQVDALAREAQTLARELQGGRLPPAVLARQQRLFHRLLDAGRSLEQEETTDERTAERPNAVAPGSGPAPLDPRVLESGTRYRLPTPQELGSLPPAYRRLILDYFERLNRPAPPLPGGSQR